MTFAKIAALAVAALEKERRTVAPEANMHRLGVVSHATERAMSRYAELTEAIETLKELGKRPA